MIGGGGVSHVEPSQGRHAFLAYYDRDSGLGMSVVRALMAEGEEVWAGGTTTHESSLSWFDGESLVLRRGLAGRTGSDGAGPGYLVNGARHGRLSVAGPGR